MPTIEELNQKILLLEDKIKELELLIAEAKEKLSKIDEVLKALNTPVKAK